MLHNGRVDTGHFRHRYTDFGHTNLGMPKYKQIITTLVIILKTCRTKTKHKIRFCTHSSEISFIRFSNSTIMASYTNILANIKIKTKRHGLNKVSVRRKFGPTKIGMCIKKT